MTGPLAGLRVLEMAALGPTPHAAMVLADLGADVIRVERPGPAPVPSETDFVLRHRRRAVADLKSPPDLAAVLDLVERSDVLIEGFRPGVAERLGLGPDICHARNPRLVYTRITGWGQQGPLAHKAGHDINYIAPTGVLAAVGRAGLPPAPPLNLVGDYGGGSMLALTGVLAALWHVEHTGKGQVVDVAMIDGTVLQSQLFLTMQAQAQWGDTPGTNLLNGGHPYYDTYRCADGEFVAVGAVEPQFYLQLLHGLGLDVESYPQAAEERYAEYKETFARIFAERSQTDWIAVFAPLDACVTAVRTLARATEEPHVVARELMVEVDGHLQAAPAPRFSSTPARAPAAPPMTTVAVTDIASTWPRRDHHTA